MKLFDRNGKVKIEVSQNEQQATEFFYDRAGNIIRKTYYASNNGVLEKTGTDTYTYDEGGRFSSLGIERAELNKNGVPVEPQEVQYHYDAQGNRVEPSSIPQLCQ